MTSTNTTPKTLSMGVFHPIITSSMEKIVLPFGEITLPARHLKEQNWNSYRIYKSETEFVTIEGEAAYDAIAKSGVPNPLRVVRAMKELGDVLTSVQLLEQTDNIQAVVEEVSKSSSGIIAPPAVANPAAV